jgi:N-acetylmuramoyl-L-alanine amidase
LKKLSFVLAIILLLFLALPAAAKSTFLINNRTTELDSEIIKGRTMVPVTVLKDYFDEQLNWKAAEKKLEVLGGAYNLKLEPTNKIAVVNDKPLALDIRPRLIRDRLFMPAKLLTELYGGQLDWSASQKAINYQTYQLQDIIVNNQDSTSEVVVTTTHFASYNAKKLANPKRLVVDLNQTYLGTIKREKIFNSQLVDGFRSSQFSVNPTITRVVIDLKEDVDYKIEQKGDKIKLKLAPANKIAVTSSIVSRSRSTPNQSSGNSRLDNNKQESNNFNLNNIKIMIDPGHGGTDPGAIGVTGLKEKDVNLELAIKLQRRLLAAGYNPILTRRGDQFISLSKRAEHANLREADLFISIHANSNSQSWINGTATYAHWNASKDNWALAWYLQSGIIERVNLKDNGLKAANFAVLRETNMPAVLLETAFLSNRKEEQLLNSTTFQSKVVSGIVQGVERYFAE